MTKDMRDITSGFRELCGYVRIGDTLQMTITADHLNGGGVLHGGMTATLLDHVSSHPVTLKEGQLMATVGLDIQYLSPAKINDVITATSSLKKQGRDIAFIDAIITNQKNDVIATSSAIYKIITLKMKK